MGKWINGFTNISTQEACMVSQKLDLDQMSERSIHILKDTYMIMLTFCYKIWVYSFCVCVCVYIYIYTRLGAKRCACKGLCTSVENKTFFFCFFEMLYCAFAWMNEYIVQIISATRLWLISRYSHHTLKKRQKMDIHVPSDFHHFAYKQTARETITDLYAENIILYG